MKDPRDGDVLDQTAWRILALNVKERAGVSAPMLAAAFEATRGADPATRLKGRLNLRLHLIGKGGRER